MTRPRRKTWLTLSKRTWLAIAVFLSCAFTYLTLLYQSKLHAASTRHFPLFVLDWLSSSPYQTHLHDHNILHKDFHFVLRVLAYNRLDSLRRCLRSLQVADYGGDRVDLLVLVDHFEAALPKSGRRSLATFPNATDENTGSSEDVMIDEFYEEPDADVEEVELSSDPVERSLQQARQMLRYLDRFRWSHGTKQVHYRSRNLGLQGQWLEAWWPVSDHQFALVVEDDMQLSPLYYRYVRSIIANYYYNPANFHPSIFGITLQRPRFVPGKHGSRIEVKNTTRLFLYQMVGSWGQVLFPKPWKEFRLWFEEHKTKGVEPILEGMVTTDWYRRLGNKIWTPWFTKFAHSRGYFNMYTNFLEQRALSVSHRAQGVNYRKEAGPDSKLIRRRGVTDINLWEMPALSTLGWYDYCFHRVFPNRLVNDSTELQVLLPSLNSKGTVALVNILGVGEDIVRNWLCQSGAGNLLLVAKDGDFSRDLARRGHAVMLVDDAGDGQYYDSSVRVMQQVVELGYSVWFARPDLSWPRHGFTDPETDKDVVAAKVGDEFHSGVFFISSSENSKLLLADMEKTVGGDKLGKALWTAATRRTVGIGELDASFATTNGSVDSGMLLFNEGVSSEYLKTAELWLVDDELACKRVSCD